MSAYLSPTTLAAEWAVSKNTVLRAVRRGDLAAWQDGRTIRIARADADAYVAARRNAPSRHLRSA